MATGASSTTPSDIENEIPLDIVPSVLVTLGVLDLSGANTTSLRSAQTKTLQAAETATALQLLASSGKVDIPSPNMVVKITASDSVALETAVDKALQAICHQADDGLTMTQLAYILTNFVEGSGSKLPLFEVGQVSSEPM